MFQKILVSQNSHKPWYYLLLFRVCRQCDLGGQVNVTIFLIPMSLSKMHFPFPPKVELPPLISLLELSSLRFLLERNIYLKLFVLFCSFSQARMLLMWAATQQNHLLTRQFTSLTPLLLTSSILFVRYLKPLLLNVLLSLSERSAAKAAQGAHLRMELSSDH